MHLRALKINGFKSFADPTELHFDRGVTAIVGPNGCGKSNIADAIRWVLGEQSAKALRGGKMQDVIFEGSDNRKPLPVCEVSLMLTECEEQLGSDYHEIEITRRVSREGSSDYFLNGKSCRLKDIQKLFMDTGVGRTSYSIMAQGQIDQILSSKPEERRAVFEEAAGITKYKSQRREALNKLALVDTNLNRVTDVINEVSRQIGSLRRQASKALRFKKLSHRLRHLDLAHGGHLYGKLRATVAELESSVNSNSGDVERFQVELAEKETLLADLKTRRQERVERVQEAQQSVFDLRSQRDQSENRAHLAEVRKNNLAERIEQSGDELESIEAQLREIAEKVDSGVQDKQLHLDILGSSDEIFRERNQELSDVESRLAAHEKDLQETRQRLLEAESALVRLRNECSNLEVEEKTSQHRQDRLAEEMDEQERAEMQARENLTRFQAQLEESQLTQSRTQQEIEEAQAMTARLATEFREAQRKIQELDRSVAQKTARQKLLQQLQEKFEGFGEGAKALLQGRLNGDFSGRKFPAVTAAIKMQPRYTKAVEALLGSAVEAVAVEDPDTATRILEELESQKIGRGILQFSAPAPHEPGSNGNLPEGIISALSGFDVPADDGPSALHALLGRCYIADTVPAFLSYWRENPQFPFLMVATLNGELIDRRGLVVGGYRKAQNNSILQREVELREIVAEIARDQEALQTLRTEAERVGQTLDQAEKDVESKRREILEIARHLSSIQAEERNATRTLEDVEAKRERLERDRVKIEESRALAVGRLEKAREQFARSEEELQGRRSRISEIENALGAIRGERDEKRESMAQARFDLAEKRQRLEALSQGLTEMEQRRHELIAAKDGRERDRASWMEQIATLENEIRGEQVKSEELAQTLTGAQESVEKIKASLVELEEEIRVIEQEQTRLRNESDRFRGQLNSGQVKLAEERSRLQFLQEEATREHQTDLSSVDWKFELWKADQPPEGIRPLDLDDEVENGEEGAAEQTAENSTEPESASVASDRQPTQEELAAYEDTEWSAVESEVKALRQRVQTMGPVNLVAIEEYGELKQRHEFLKTQSDDLVSSRDELLKAIDDINQTSKKQFAETFEQIRKNFIQTFTTLFGGGHAGLQLIESEDVLESGIEIVAQPPGTKLKSVTLLSGGQKTMTAVGLLFAIYMVKPSPFCLLDELDAPLDESNIGRFTTLLKQFTARSQFIIITHNKRTISAAQAIYGVTMQEKGVSKTISMRFHAETDHAEIVRLTMTGAAASSPTG